MNNFKSKISFLVVASFVYTNALNGFVPGRFWPGWDMLDARHNAALHHAMWGNCYSGHRENVELHSHGISWNLENKEKSLDLVVKSPEFSKEEFTHDSIKVEKVQPGDGRPTELEIQYGLIKAAISCVSLYKNSARYHLLIKISQSHAVEKEGATMSTSSTWADQREIDTDLHLDQVSVKLSKKDGELRFVLPKVEQAPAVRESILVELID
jgi:hypothetical protein